MNSTELRGLYRNMGKKPPSEFADPKQHKYRARRTKSLDGHVFDSAGESQAYVLLCLWEAAGVISQLRVQPVFLLQPAFDEAKPQRDQFSTIGIGRISRSLHHLAITYRADFQFVRDGKTVVVDFKSPATKTPTYRVKMKLFRSMFPDIEFEEWDRAKLKEASR